MKDTQEQWKQVRGYEGLYVVSSLGRVKRYGSSKLRKTTFDRDGYERLILCKDSEQKSHYIHRLMVQSFYAPSMKKYEVDHINGIKNDNRIENLSIVNRKENMKRAQRLGLITWKYHPKRSTQEDIDRIVALRGIGLSKRQISKTTGFSIRRISKIIARRCEWHSSRRELDKF